MAVVSFLGVLGCWFYMGRALKKQFEQVAFATEFIVATPLFFMILVFDDPVLICRTGLFLCLLFYVAIFDDQTQTIPQFVHPLIFCVGCIGINGDWLMKQAIPGAMIPGLLVACSGFLIKRIRKLEQSIGLGDIKLIMGCGFYLGLDAGFVGLFIGLFFSILWSGMKHLEREEVFAFAPFLCVGFTIVLFFERMVFQ